MAYSDKEKSSWKRGFFAGLKKAMKGKTNKKKSSKKSSYKRKSKNGVNKSSFEYVLASRYARHMGVKYGLSEKEIQKNTIDHYHQARRDNGFYIDLIDNYATDDEIDRSVKAPHD